MPATDGAWRNLGGQRRTIARLVYARDKGTPGYVCPVCKQGVDWTLTWPDPMSRSIDHATELQDGGALTDLDNCWTAHLGCNSSKGATRRQERERQERAAGGTTIIVDAATL